MIIYTKSEALLLDLQWHLRALNKVRVALGVIVKHADEYKTRLHFESICSRLNVLLKIEMKKVENLSNLVDMLDEEGLESVEEYIQEDILNTEKHKAEVDSITNEVNILLESLQQSPTEEANLASV